MEGEESIDPLTQTWDGDRGSAGSNSPDESDVDNVSKASPSLQGPPVDSSEPLNAA